MVNNQIIMDEDGANTLKLSVTNMLTGEISEKEIQSLSEGKDFYLELKAALAVFKKAEDKLKSWLDYNLGNDDEYQFADGTTLRRVYRTTKTWTFDGLRQAGLDENAIAVVSKVDMTAAKALVKEMVERGELPAGAGKVLDDTAEVKAQKPFVEVR